MTHPLVLAFALLFPTQAGDTAAVARFWQIIEQSQGIFRSCGGVSKAVEAQLTLLPTPAVLEFDAELRRRLAESYSWDLWAVAYEANGGASDDGFEYFRGWLITKGRKRFERALADPPAAIEGTWPVAYRECEDILAASYNVLAARAVADSLRTRVPYPSEPLGKRWTEDALPVTHPDLVRRVGRWSWLP